MSADTPSGAARRRALRGESRPVRRTARFGRGVSRAPDPLQRLRAHALRCARQLRAARRDDGGGVMQVDVNSDLCKTR